MFLAINENNSLPETSFSGPSSIYFFLEFSNNNSRIKREICSKLTIEEP